jgi:hypothetical protein
VTIQITKSCSVRLNGEIKPLKAGEIITLPPEKAQKMISAGYAETIPTDTDEYRELCREISELDPKGDCWNWIQKEHPELWREHITAFRSGDIARARATFHQMIEAWTAQQ